MTCARKSVPFGDLDQIDMYCSAFALNALVTCFLVCFWQAAPWSHEDVALLTPSRIVVMPIMLLLAFGADLLFWMLCDAMLCYADQVGYAVAVLLMIGACIGIASCLVSFMCWTKFMSILIRTRRERRRETNSDIELDTQSLASVSLPEPPKVRARESENTEEAILPAYVEST